MSELDLLSFVEDLQEHEVRELLSRRIALNISHAQASLNMLSRQLSLHEGDECSTRELEDRSNVCVLVLQSCVDMLLKGEFPKYLILSQRFEDEYAAMIEQSNHADHD
jgi:hypothetical protein